MLDFLSSAESAEVATFMEQAGLERATCFATNQLKDACTLWGCTAASSVVTTAKRPLAPCALPI